MIVDRIILILSVEKYRTVKLSILKDFETSYSFSFLDAFDSYINREKYLEIALKIEKVINFRQVAYQKQPTFPKEEHEYIIEYLKKKLLRCKSGSAKYLETLHLLENIQACNFNISIHDSNICYRFRKIKDYLADIDNYKKYLLNQTELKTIDTKLNMTIEEFIKEYQ